MKSIVPFFYMNLAQLQSTAWKVPQYGVFSGLYFPVFGLNTVKYGPEKTPYLDTFHSVIISKVLFINYQSSNYSIRFTCKHFEKSSKSLREKGSIFNSFTILYSIQITPALLALNFTQLSWKRYLVSQLCTSSFLFGFLVASLF